MAFVVAPSRNRIVQQAFAGLEKERRAEKKAPAEPDDVHTKPAKPAQVRADVHRKAGKVKNAKLPRAKWLAECQAIINRYVRLRDRALPCCSCDRPATWGGQWHASHYRSVGAASGIRFHLWNIHKGCSICNNHLSGNLVGYHPRILARIGAEKVEWLNAQNAVVKHSVPYLKRFKAVMGKRLRRLEERLQ